MQGPPGTGKSQTIANLIAESIGQGKRILFVSEKAAALDVVYKRLEASGLNEYCLMLHGEHAARREVVQSLDESLTSSLVPHPSIRPDELERLENLRTLLNDSVELLHLPWAQLGGRSLREVHAELAELHAAPSIAGAPTASSSEGREVIDEQHRVEEIFQALCERWRVGDPAFLWHGYDAERFNADDHGRVLGLLGHLRDATDGLGPTLFESAAAVGLDAVSHRTPGSARRLSELGVLLEERRALDGRWLTTAGADALSKAAADADQAYRRRSDAQHALDAEYGGSAGRSLPLGLTNLLSDAQAEVTDACGWASAWKSDLLSLSETVKALDGLPEIVAAVTDRAAEICELLGQPTDHLDAPRTEQLIELAELAFRAEHRPEAQWLVAAGLQRAREAHEGIQAALCSYQQKRDLLFQSYKPDVLDLDATALRSRFATDYTSVFSKLSGDYRRDAKAIKTARTDGKLPATLDEDLKLAAEARELGTEIDAAASQLKLALGSYHQGRDTDPDATGKAIEAAWLVSQLSDREADLTTLSGRVGVGSPPDPACAQAADRLAAAHDKLTEGLAPLQPYVTRKPLLGEMSFEALAERVAALDGPIRRMAGLIDTLNRGAEPPAADYELVLARARLSDEAHHAQATIDQASEAWQTAIGSSFAAESSDFEGLIDTASWLLRVFELVDDVALPALHESLAQQTGAPWLAPLRNALTEFDRTAAAWVELFDEPARRRLLETLDGRALGEVTGWLGELEACVDDLHDWTQWRAWRRRATEQGWNEFVDSLVDRGVAAGHVVPAFKRAFWNSRLEALYEEESDLAEDLRGGAFQRWVDQFCDLDSRLVSSGADRLIAKREESRTSHVAVTGGEVDLLRREARKKVRHLPVRVLLSRIPTLLSQLKPCLMMSPLTVSHFLSAQHNFDLVVFDEASQVTPQDAINCIYRGAQLIVAGDDKQLPPTPFFQIAELDELSPEDEDDVTSEDMESILDSCSALLPAHPLRWHYRSRWEPLIAFSNTKIYNGSLITFPSVEEISQRMGVAFTHVPDGIYDRGRSATNRVEAQMVAQRVAHYLRDGTGRSVGVIAFNSAQANAIAEELDLIRVQNPELEDRFRGDRLDAVFVKHLEAVQGDERDVILLSVGYGRDVNGKFLMNFGPVNKDGGHRRLNVAVTRAREKLEVVSSVRAHEFGLSDEASLGSRLLRDYIRYAETGGRWEDPEDDPGRPDHWPTQLEAAIAEAVVDLGYEPVPRIGVGSFRIDIGVRDPQRPNRFLLGIESDGPGYARTPTARDRERLRHAVLADLGWQIHRIWSLDWVRSRANEIERLSRALEGAKAAAVAAEAVATAEPDHADSDQDNADAPLAVRERVERVVHELSNSAAAQGLPWTEPYERAELGRQRSNYEFHETVNRRVQTDLLCELLAVEAPVSVDYAIRRLAECWGLQRAGHRVVSAGRQAVSQAGRRKAVEVRGEFLWRPHQALTLVRIPDPKDPATRRDIDDIPPEEIDLAIARLRESTVGMPDEQLLVQTARVLGFDRTGERIRSVLTARLRKH
jgi:hypothetical protein